MAYNGAMPHYVDITFDCLPLRSMGRFDPPLDASPELAAFCERVRRAAIRHGTLNTYYLHHAQGVFHLTNDDQIGMVQFAFEGTALTDADDLKTLDCELDVRLEREICDWLTAEAVQWLADTLRQAVRIEFDRYIAAGDLERTIQRMERLRAESDARGGFLGMGL
jgi:hypothetical protein